MAAKFDHKTTHEEEKKWLAALLEGYRTARHLSLHEIDLIPKLIDFA